MVHEHGLVAYVFRGKDRAIAISWCEAGRSRKLKLTSALPAYDIMENTRAREDLLLEQSPVYLVGKEAKPVLSLLLQ